MSRATPLEWFRKACGLEAPLGLCYQEVGSPDVAPVPLDESSPFLIVGRHPMADLRLDHRQVSRRHAYLQAVAGQIFCVDLKSRTKLHWDDPRGAQPWGWLVPGQSLRIGPYRIRWADRSTEEDPDLEPPDPFSPTGGDPKSQPLPRPLLELPFRTGGTSSAWEMGGLLALVGRSDDCQFVLDDSSISQHHACLVRTPLGAWVVDMGARAGVHVNGTRVRWAWLADGDLIRLGLFTMVFRYDRPPEGIGRDDVPVEAGASRTGWIAEDPDSTDRDRRALAVRSKGSPTDLISARISPHADLPAAPAPVNRSEWEPISAAGPSPLAMWQQQMQLMETFHRDMAMMVQMFVAMHREFQASVRGELDRVQELTRELSRLNKRLDQLPEPAGAGPAPVASRSKPKVQPVPRNDPPRPEAKPRTGSARQPREPAERSRDDRGGDPGINGHALPAASNAAKPRAGAPKLPSAEMYADLTRRISQLQQERRGYWERILKTISG